MTKNIGIAFGALAAATLSNGTAGAFTVSAGCAVPNAGSATARPYYVDPAKGSDLNDGSQAHPWKSIRPTGANPGDTILLMSGLYGDIKLNSAINADFVTIKPAPGQTPILKSLQLLGSAKWIIQGLKFHALADDYDPMVNISGNSFSGSGHDIIFDGNDLASQDDVSAWRQSDWVTKARYITIFVDGGDVNSSRMKCVSVTNNMIKNVRAGIIAEADNTVVDSNSVDNFGDDAIDFAASNLTISNNKITNALDIGDGNHGDAIQGQTGNGAAGKTVFNNILIEGNIIMAKTNPELAFPGELQGITAFDMDWSNVRVINNVIVTNTYHGLSFYSLHTGLIANNTVLGTNAALNTWIGVFEKSHQGTSSNDVVVRNNIATVLDMDAPAPSITADHNLVGVQIVTNTNNQPQWLKTPGSYANSNRVDANGLAKIFERFDVAKSSYDLHLIAGSAAIGAGVADAPLMNDAANSKLSTDLGALPFAPPTASRLK